MLNKWSILSNLWLNYIFKFKPEILAWSMVILYYYSFIQHIFIEDLPWARHCYECWGNTHEQNRQKLMFASHFAGYKTHSYLFFVFPPYSVSSERRPALSLGWVRRIRLSPRLCFSNPEERLICSCYPWLRSRLLFLDCGNLSKSWWIINMVTIF